MFAITMPTSAMALPVERSMPAVMMTKVTPTPTIAGMEASRTISIRLSKLRNFPLPAPARIVNSTIRTSSMPMEISRRIIVWFICFTCLLSS